MRGLWPCERKSWEMERERRTKRWRVMSNRWVTGWVIGESTHRSCGREEQRTWKRGGGGKKLRYYQEWEGRRKCKMFYWFFNCKTFYTFCLGFFLWLKIVYIWPIILPQNKHREIWKYFISKQTEHKVPNFARKLTFFCMKVSIVAVKLQPLNESSLLSIYS